MDSERAPNPPAPSATTQRLARIVLVVGLLGFGTWILREFLPALAWAAVLAIALWPLYQRLLVVLPRHGDRALAPAMATLGITLAIFTPLALLGIAVARESHFVLGFIHEARQQGIPVPDWVTQLPYAGSALADWWRANLSDPEMADELFGRVNLHTVTGSLRQYGREIVHRVAILLFTLLTLFFLFRDGEALTWQLRDLSDRLIGARGEVIGRHMMAAVHGTVSGLVLVGLGEGILLGIIYFAVGLPYPASIGALTGVAAVIPFAAPVVYCLAGVYLFAVGKTVGAIVVLVSGSIILFVADHFIRPVLIGGAARLPFLLVLLGILGGLERMGFIGLFVGPAVMAALVALWREWTEPETMAEAPVPTAAASPAIGRSGHPREA